MLRHAVITVDYFVHKVAKSYNLLVILLIAFFTNTVFKKGS